LIVDGKSVGKCPWLGGRNHVLTYYGDEDCDGEIDDDAVNQTPWYADADGDGYGDELTKDKICPPVSADYSLNGDDCDDTDAGVHPAATESCDDVDEDCDGSIDDSAIDAEIWYADADGDGFGDASITTTSCDPPTGYSTDSTDCNDADATIEPDTACNWVVRIPTPGSAEIYVYSPTGQDVDVDGTAVTVPAGGIASTTASGEIRCEGDDPYLVWVVTSGHGGDQLALFQGEDGPLGSTLYGWSGGYLQLFNPTGAVASVTVTVWDGTGWSAWTTTTVAAGSTATVYTDWGMYQVASDLPLTAYGLAVGNIENHFPYLIGQVGFTGLCADAAGCRVTVDTAAGPGIPTTVAYADGFSQIVSAGTLYEVSSTGLMILRDEATPYGYATSDGTTMDADFVPGLTGSTLDTDFLVWTTLGTSTASVDRLTDLTVLPFEDATTVTITTWDGTAFVAYDEVLLASDESYALTDLDPDEVWSITSDAPVQILMGHASSEFAFSAPALYFAD
jgi:hypothetical protein